jgi:hypothetical protein
MDFDKLNNHHFVTMQFISDWFITDPGLQDWKKRGELRNLVDKWHDICDEYDEDELVKLVNNA